MQELYNLYTDNELLQGNGNVYNSKFSLLLYLYPRQYDAVTQEWK